MKLREVIDQLTQEGYQANLGRIRCAIRNGYLHPLPTRGARGAYEYTEAHLEQLREYFVMVRPGPRPESPQENEVRAEFDRLHRLAKQKRLLERRREFDATLRLLEGIPGTRAQVGQRRFGGNPVGVSREEAPGRPWR